MVSLFVLCVSLLRYWATNFLVKRIYLIYSLSRCLVWRAPSACVCARASISLLALLLWNRALAGPDSLEWNTNMSPNSLVNVPNECYCNLTTLFELTHTEFSGFSSSLYTLTHNLCEHNVHRTNNFASLYFALPWSVLLLFNLLCFKLLRLAMLYSASLWLFFASLCIALLCIAFILLKRFAMAISANALESAQTAIFHEFPAKSNCYWPKTEQNSIIISKDTQGRRKRQRKGWR